MKNLFSFITLLILVHITTELTEAQPEPVLDSDGNALLRGERYYVVPLTPADRVQVGAPVPDGGLVPYAIPNTTCSYGVSQLRYGEGIPLIFRPVNSSNLGGAIYDFTDLYISFFIPYLPTCAPYGVWKRGEYDEETKQYFVKISGATPRILGNGTIGNAFQIRKLDSFLYRFVFCPETCISCLPICNDVGIFFQDGVRRLAESRDAFFPFSFRKAAPKLELASY